MSLEFTLPVTTNRVVGLSYTLHNDAGELLDQAGGDELLWYLHGHGNLLPTVEARLEGLLAGQGATFVLDPAQGYGERDEARVLPVERSLLPPDVATEVGEELLIDLGDGPQICVVAKLTEGEAFIDLNHPMAGIRLHFSMKVDSVRRATEEEVSHGHVHGPGGHHH
jgi:FKBP-type peptidyl-prolyl cis-trans isomerase SlyD